MVRQKRSTARIANALDVSASQKLWLYRQLHHKDGSLLSWSRTTDVDDVGPFNDYKNPNLYNAKILHVAGSMCMPKLIHTSIIDVFCE